MPDRAARARLLKAQRDYKMRDLFEGRRYTIVREFELPEGQITRTPFGYPVRRGYVLQEIEDPDNTFVVGYVVLKAARDEFRAVSIPKKRRGRPPGTPEPEPARISDLLMG